MDKNFHIKCLKEELKLKQSKNSSYSHSALARDLQLNSGSLSEILSGKRNVSFKTCQKVFNLFPWPAQKRKEFLYCAANVLINSGIKRVHPEFRKVLTDKDRVLFESDKIEQETFVVISQWYHTSILEMTFTENLLKNDNKKIALRLDIPEKTAQKATQRLLKLGYLKEIDGVLIKTHKSLSLAAPNKTTESLKKHQQQILKKSIEKLKTDPIELRNHSGMAMAIDPKNIPQAKKEIRLFLHKMCNLLESGQQTKVYQLNVNLFSMENSIND